MKALLASIGGITALAFFTSLQPDVPTTEDPAPTSQVTLQADIPQPSPLPSPLPSPILTPTEAATKKPTAKPSKTAEATSCDPNYSGACVPIASDVDCARGSGNGPAYVRGPVYVIGSDIYDLDRDGDGVGCE